MRHRCRPRPAVCCTGGIVEDTTTSFGLQIPQINFRRVCKRIYLQIRLNILKEEAIRQPSPRGDIESICHIDAQLE